MSTPRVATPFSFHLTKNDRKSRAIVAERLRECVRSARNRNGKCKVSSEGSKFVIK